MRRRRDLAAAECALPTRSARRILAAAVVAPGILVASVLLQGPAWGATVGGSWHLDETSRTGAVDSSGSGNNGLLRGAVGVGQPGAVGTAYSFATRGSWVEVPSSASLNPGSRTFSYSARLNLTTGPGSGATYDIIRKGLSTTAGGEYKLEVVAGGYVRCTAKDAARNTVTLANKRIRVTDGRWHYVACARVGTAWRVTVDGSVVSTTSRLGVVANSRSLAIGSKYGQEDGTPGRVDEVQVTITG